MIRAVITLAGLLLLWQGIILVTGVPSFILPSPFEVLRALISRSAMLFEHAAITALEILLGWLIGAMIGMMTAMALLRSGTMRRWMMPVLVISQAIPFFAIAPVLVLWLGFGIASKVAMAVLIIYFPVTAAFYDGLKRTDPLWLDQARVMRGTGLHTLLHVRLPAALPALMSGLRIAASIAPIGAIVGEWVGSSHGLGYVMLQANARSQVDVMFAALFLLALMAIGLWSAVGLLARYFVPWSHETLEGDHLETS